MANISVGELNDSTPTKEAKMPADRENALKYEFADMGPDERLKQLILYVSGRCEDDPTFGATKLNKILYFSDFFSYLKRGKPVTGAVYQRLNNGPAPKRLVPLRDELVEGRQLVVMPKKFHDREQLRTIALEAPDLEVFTGDGIALVDEVIRVLWGKTAAEVSELSHDAGWRSAGHQENIPYQAAYLSDEGVTKRSRGDGDYLIGSEMSPGDWRSTPGHAHCYWDVSNANGDITGSYFGESGGVASIPASGFEFDTNDCGQWEYLGRIGG